MASGGYGPVLRQVGRLLGAGGTAAALGEGALLRRFAEARDGAAFEALVGRHGPMVLGTCRRILADPHAVDDAFQATFLVLARRAGSIRDGDRLGPWLHGVARRVAARSRAQAARRSARERPGAEEQAVADPDPADARELRAALDEELARLPEKYRAPLVLCYLQGLTHDEAAHQLGWPVGTVRSRLARGRDRLRSGLTRRGLAPSAAVPVILPAAAIPEALLSSTIRTATIAGSAPAHVASLAKGALIAMTWHKLKAIAAIGLLAGLAVGGAGALAQQGGRPAGEAPSPSKASGEESLDLMTKEVAAIEAAIPKAEDFVARLRRDREAGLREIAALRQKLGMAPTPDPAKSEPPKIDPPTTAPVVPKPIPPDPRPTIHTLPGQPVLYAVVSAGRDRVTIIDSQSQKRASFRIPGEAAEVTPVIGGDLVALILKGHELTRTAVFDRKSATWSEHGLGASATEVHPSVNPSIANNFGQQSWMVGFQVKAPKVRHLLVFDGADGTWSAQDLREPAPNPVGPIVGNATARYRIGRFMHIYSAAARKWSVLELKREPEGERDFGAWVPDSNGRMTVFDGDLIHFYDIKTGDWTHIDTKDER